MNALLYRIVPFVLAMIVGEFVYYQLGKSYKLTEKSYQKFHDRNESRGLFHAIADSCLFDYMWFFGRICGSNPACSTSVKVDRLSKQIYYHNMSKMRRQNFVCVFLKRGKL